VAGFVAFCEDHRWDLDDSWTFADVTRFSAIFGHSSWPLDRILVTAKCSTDVLTVSSIVLCRAKIASFVAPTSPR